MKNIVTEDLKKELNFDEYIHKEECLAENALEITSKTVKTWEYDILTLVNLIRKVSQIYAGIKYPIRKDYLPVVKAYKDRSFPHQLPILRPDGIITDGTLKIIEFNIDSGIGGFWELEKIQNFLRKSNYIIDGIYPSPKKYWIKLFEDIAKRLRRPIYVGIVGSAYLEESNRQKVKDITNWLGDSELLVARYVEPHNLKYEKDKVSDDDYSYDVLYRYRCLLHSEDQTEEMIQMYLQGISKKTIILSDPLDLLIEQKAGLALLYSLKEDQNLFNTEEKKIIESYIPWTYSLDNKTLVFQNKSYQLEDLLLSQQFNLVLKKIYSHHGDYVFIGAQLSQEKWKLNCNRALENPKDWVVQERLISDTNLFSYTDGNSVRVNKRKHYFFSPYFFGYNFAGAFVRVQQTTNQQVLSVPSLSPMGLAGIKIMLEDD